MEHKVKEIREEAEKYAVNTIEELEAFRISFLGSKGKVKALFTDLKNVDQSQKREAGQLINGLREFVQEKFDAFKDRVENKSKTAKKLDLSRPGDQIEIGTRHPLSLVRS